MLTIQGQELSDEVKTSHYTDISQAVSFFTMEVESNKKEFGIKSAVAEVCGVYDKGVLIDVKLLELNFRLVSFDAERNSKFIALMTRALKTASYKANIDTRAIQIIRNEGKESLSMSIKYLSEIIFDIDNFQLLNPDVETFAFDLLTQELEINLPLWTGRERLLITPLRNFLLTKGFRVEMDKDGNTISWRRNAGPSSDQDELKAAEKATKIFSRAVRDDLLKEALLNGALQFDFSKVTL